jgi:dTMP kinase
MAGTGRFITFEGGEGAGKTTQIALLAEHLIARGLAPVVTREPGGTEEGVALRRLLLTAEGAGWTPMAETLLMVADRAQHVERVIRPALAQGHPVISDRYIFSTFAYQGRGRGIAKRVIRNLHHDACGDLWPSLILVLDIDPRLGLARSSKRLQDSASDENRFEALDLAFHDRVRRGFLEEAAKRPGRALVLDATQPVQAIQAEIRQIVDSLLDAG